MEADVTIRSRRRLDVLDAAVRVLSERGFAQTRVSDVADRCGISPSLIHYYFDSREQLLLETLAHANDQFFLRLTRRLREQQTALQQLEWLIALALPKAPDEPDAEGDWDLWLDVWVQSLRNPDVDRERETLERRFRLTIRDVIEKGRASGEFPMGEESRLLGARIGAVIDGMAVQMLMNDVDFPPDATRALCMELALTLIRSSAASSPMSSSDPGERGDQL